MNNSGFIQPEPAHTGVMVQGNHVQMDTAIVDTNHINGTANINHGHIHVIKNPTPTDELESEAKMQALPSSPGSHNSISKTNNNATPHITADAQASISPSENRKRDYSHLHRPRPSNAKFKKKRRYLKKNKTNRPKMPKSPFFGILGFFEKSPKRPNILKVI